MQKFPEALIGKGVTYPKKKKVSLIQCLFAVFLVAFNFFFFFYLSFVFPLYPALFFPHASPLFLSGSSGSFCIFLYLFLIFFFYPLQLQKAISTQDTLHK